MGIVLYIEDEGGRSRALSWWLCYGDMNLKRKTLSFILRKRKYGVFGGEVIRKCDEGE